MGEVYRAVDTRLEREVAIKSLPAAFATDPERLARFEREAKLLAQLHHPNIASIFGLEELDGAPALVMELVEGPTLADRLTAGALPVEQALDVARQIAEALEAAHEKGIVHRDLKPANVKLGADGQVKVLDFGLAKALDAATAPVSADLAHSPTLMNSPTITGAPGTQLGVILGTAAYMAPEQAAGGVVDRRADIWSFGVVLWEMLTGRRLFDGESVSHVLAGVLKDAPDFAALPRDTPEPVVTLVQRCLRRKPRERLQAIGEARAILEEVVARGAASASGVGRAAASGVAAPASASRLAWAAAGLALVVAIAFAGLWLHAARTPAAGRVVQASLVPPSGWSFGDGFAVSPDGTRVVYEAFRAGTRALWLRSLETGDSTQLAGTEGGLMPFWSPDGTQLGFFADGKLRRIALAGGAAQTICEAPTPRGGAWGSDGRIVFGPAFRTGLSIVAASGGEPRVLTRLDTSPARHEKSHRFPIFLPDGRTVLFVAQTAEGGTPDDQSTIDALDLATGRRTHLVTVNCSPQYDPRGELLYWREGTLFAQRFDARRLAVAGEPRPVAAPVAYTDLEQMLVSVSAEGTLVYLGGTRGTSASLVLMNRQGLGEKVLRERELLGDFALSHDGKRLVYAAAAPGQGSTDLWVQDIARGTTSRLTFEAGSESSPVWSPDDRQVYYANDHKNDGIVYRKPADGTGTAEEVAAAEAGILPESGSADGRSLVVWRNSADTGRDIFRLDLATHRMSPLVQNPGDDLDAVLASDDRLLAYSSQASGVWQVYVQAVSGEPGRWQVSTEGGIRPRWRADGRELFFIVPPDRLMAVDVTPGPVPTFSAPHELFRQPMTSFDVMPDGQGFVLLRPADADTTRPLNLVVGWPRLLAAEAK